MVIGIRIKLPGITQEQFDTARTRERAALSAECDR